LESAVSCNVPAYTGHGVVVEDAARKRELRLLKNRLVIRIDLPTKLYLYFIQYKYRGFSYTTHEKK